MFCQSSSYYVQTRFVTLKLFKNLNRSKKCWFFTFTISFMVNIKYSKVRLWNFPLHMCICFFIHWMCVVAVLIKYDACPLYCIYYYRLGCEMEFQPAQKYKSTRGINVYFSKLGTTYDVSRCQFHQHFRYKFFVLTSFWQLFLHTCN